MSALKSMIIQVEEDLARSYGFRINTSASDCLLPPEAASRLKAGERAAVLVYEEAGSDELELGVYLHPQIMEELQSSDLLRNLKLENLDVFCVLIEEISHFHLVANRAIKGQGVSRLELEWQGEVDKVLLAGSYLLAQTGQSYLLQLAHLIFDRSQCYSAQVALYDEALFYAARHWYQLIADLKSHDAREQLCLARDAFRGTYHLHWSDKLSALQRRRK